MISFDAVIRLIGDLQAEELRRWIDERWVRPEGDGPTYVFLEVDVARVRLIRELKERYRNRVVLFDLPPVLGADDALAFMPQVDAALLVVGEEHTRREDLLRSFEILREIPVIGTVLNGSRTDVSLTY